MRLQAIRLILSNRLFLFEEFEKLDIRVGTVLECETVPKMKKLLKFKIADGLENRIIVSGIAQHYAPGRTGRENKCCSLQTWLPANSKTAW